MMYASTSLTNYNRCCSQIMHNAWQYSVTFRCADFRSGLSSELMLNTCHPQVTTQLFNPHTAEVLRTNAEHMSPSGKPPFLRAGPYVISEVEPIIKFVSTKGHSLSEKLDRPQQAEMKAYLALVQGTLGNAELYISWCDPTTASEISRPRYSSPYPWPLNTVLAYRKQWDVQNQLKTLGWHTKTLEEVYDEVDNCCKALAQRLGNHHYFFKQGPTELDALVFGHLYTILTTPLTDNCLADIVKEYGNLINFCRHIEKKFFEERERGPKD
ncbi:MTX2 [Branchiostoma lanceolatum]|uniref:MTX2 protein n=1 Tax=Branchiostoma lanceolatum TaxID=7740 RepID=A0A8J9YST7_BRALA|nr:MTX2 [Branchiostoma lanceolatum]